MLNIVIFEDAKYVNLLPLVYWRTACELRLGYDTLLDKIHTAWRDASLNLFVRPYLAEVLTERYAYPVNQPIGEPALFLNGRLLVGKPFDIPLNTVFEMDGTIVAFRLDAQRSSKMTADLFLDPAALKAALDGLPQETLNAPDVKLLRYTWDFVHANGHELNRQWHAHGNPCGVEGHVYEGAFLLNREGIHIGAGSKIMPCVVLDAEEGPIYIGSNVRISPHSSIQGPCYIGDNSLIQASAVIRQNTTIGPVCKVGGEVEDSIIHSYSNKQHDGFLGHAYIGQWINIAADSINSDLKNTYGSVRVPINGIEVDSGEMFVGLTVGDHSKCGINSSFATGSIVGFSANLFMSAHIPKFVPSFAWYTDTCRDTYDPQRGLEVARKVMARRKVEMTEAQQRLYMHILEEAGRHEHPDPAPKTIRE